MVEFSDEEWNEYYRIEIVRSNETPSEWMNRILPHLIYFKENDLLPNGVKNISKLENW